MLGIYFLIRGVEEMRHHSFSGVTVGEQQPLGQRKGSMAFKDLSATTIAEQLTFLEYRMLRRIPVRITHFLVIFFLGCCCFFFFQKWYLTTRAVFLEQGPKTAQTKMGKVYTRFRPKQRKNPANGAAHTYMAWCTFLAHRQRKFSQAPKK